MAFQLKPDESVAKGVRRLARAQIDKALDGLTGRDGTDPEEAVHDARKRFKRVRAVIRLARGGLGRKLADREDTRFRDAGRPLSEVRDAGVLVQAFDGLVERSATRADRSRSARPEKRSCAASGRSVGVCWRRETPWRRSPEPSRRPGGT